MGLRTAFVATVLVAFSCASALAAPSAATLARGKYLVEGVVACGNCHIARGAQGEPLFILYILTRVRSPRRKRGGRPQLSLDNPSDLSKPRQPGPSVRLFQGSYGR